MQLLKIKINKYLFIDNYHFQNQENNLEYLSLQAEKENDLKKKLNLLNKICFKVEKFHSFFHFEQSYLHLKTAIRALKKDQKFAEEQLHDAIFQDHLNQQAIDLLKQRQSTNTYQKPFISYKKYLEFACAETINHLPSNVYWQEDDLSNKLSIIKDSHQNYHCEASKIYLNRSQIHQALGEIDLANNDLIKASNLDNLLFAKEYFNFVKKSAPKIILCLGSNLGDREYFLKKAASILQARQVLNEIKYSSILNTDAILPDGAPLSWDMPYLNQVIMGESNLLPEHLLNAIKIIEFDLGRASNLRWAPRNIDIDILAYDNIVIDHALLKIPHPELLNRPWAMKLFSEIYPGWLYPVDGAWQNKNIKEIYENC